MFDIYFTDEPVAHDDPSFEALWGEIRIGAFREKFVASVMSWNIEQYEKQWETALRRILAGSTQSVLITDYVEPGLASGGHLWWWPLYREGDSIYIQNGLHPLYRKDRSIYIQDQLESSGPLDRPFFSERAWESVRERKTMNAEGSELSEWVTAVGSIEQTILRRFK